MSQWFDTIVTQFGQLPWDAIGQQLTYNPESPMIFSSGIFLWLFAGFIIVYAMLHRHLAARLIFVTAFSYYFYYKSSGLYFFLLALVAVVSVLAVHLLRIKLKEKKCAEAGFVPPVYYNRENIGELIEQVGEQRLAQL